MEYKYYWINCCLHPEDMWTECTKTGIKIYGYDFSADDNGNLLYKKQIIEFPNHIEFSK